MQTDPGGLNALTAADNRIPCVLLEINWVKDAVDLTDPSSGTWSDESSYLEEISGDDTLKAPGQSVVNPSPKPPATCTLVLSNVSVPGLVVPRFASGRSDGALYAYIGNGGYYQTPVRVWTGYMEFTAVSLAITLQGGGCDGVQKTITVSAAGTVKQGMVLLLDNEWVPVTQVSGTTCYLGGRGFKESGATSHAAGITIYRAGGMTIEFDGGIQREPENVEGGTVTLTCLDRSIFIGKNKQNSSVYVDQTESQLIATFLGLAGSGAPYAPIPSGQRSLDAGLFNFPFGYVYNENVYDECCKVANAAGGTFRFTKSGLARYENMFAWYGASSQWTFTAAEMENVQPQTDYESVFSDVTVYWSSRVKGPAQVVFASLRAFSIPAGGTLSKTFDLATPAMNIAQPVCRKLVGTEAHSQDDSRDVVAVAGNVDITDQITLSSFTVYGQRVDVVFSNAHASLAAEVTRFQLRGNPILGGPQENIPLHRTTVPATVPAQMLQLGQTQDRYNWYLCDEAPALGMGNYVADRVKTARPLYPIKAARHVPQLEVGDMTLLTVAKAFSSSPTGYVIAKRWSIKGVQTDSPLAQMDVDVLDSTGLYQSNAYYKVGTDLLNNAKVLF